jgi:hypothetical protein
MRLRSTTRVLSVLLTCGVVAAAHGAEAQNADVIGTWRGSAYEFASSYLQGRADISLTVTPDGRWTSLWRQAGREQRSTGTWHLAPACIVFETDSREKLPPQLSLRHRGEEAYGTAVTALPEGRSATLSIALTRQL